MRSSEEQIFLLGRAWKSASARSQKRIAAYAIIGRTDFFTRESLERRERARSPGGRKRRRRVVDLDRRRSQRSEQANGREAFPCLFLRSLERLSASSCSSKCTSSGLRKFSASSDQYRVSLGSLNSSILRPGELRCAHHETNRRKTNCVCACVRIGARPPSCVCFLAYADTLSLHRAVEYEWCECCRIASVSVENFVSCVVSGNEAFALAFADQPVRPAAERATSGALGNTWSGSLAD